MIVHCDDLVHTEARVVKGMYAVVEPGVLRVKLTVVVLVVEVGKCAELVASVEFLKRRAFHLPDGVLVILPGVKQ